MESINVKNLHESQILQKLLDATKAELYEASAEEDAELQEMKAFAERSQADRKAQETMNKAAALERAMLEQAKGAVS